MLKAIAIDQSYIDYAAAPVGIRVRRDCCRPIILERGRWTEYGASYSIPVDPTLLDWRSTAMSALASNVKYVEDATSGAPGEISELRMLIEGEIAFADALANSGSKDARDDPG